MKLNEEQMLLVTKILNQAKETLKILLETPMMDNGYGTQVPDTQSPNSEELNIKKKDSIETLRKLIYPEPIQYSKHDIISLKHATDLLTGGKLNINNLDKKAITAHLDKAEHEIKTNITSKTPTELALAHLTGMLVNVDYQNSYETDTNKAVQNSLERFFSDTENRKYQDESSYKVTTKADPLAIGINVNIKVYKIS